MKKKRIKVFIFSILLICLFLGLYFAAKIFFPDCACPEIPGKLCPCSAKTAAQPKKLPLDITRNVPTIIFNCGDWGLSIYKPNDISDYIVVKSSAWGMGWNSSEPYELKKATPETLEEYSKKPLRVMTKWDQLQQRWIYENIDTNGWTLYFADKKSVRVWNNGKKWILQSHPCDERLQEEKTISHDLEDFL